MSTASHNSDLGIRVGIIGCGRAARAHAGRLRAISGVRIVGCADLDLDRAKDFALSDAGLADATSAAFGDHRDLLAQQTPDVVAIFTPHRMHYRHAVDSLQAGAHVFVEKPLSTNAQEAADIVQLAKGRNRLVGVGHQYRLEPSMVELRSRLNSGLCGRIHLIAATFAAPWIQEHSAPEDAWRLDPKVSGGGFLADAGIHMLDILLWSLREPVVEVAAFQAHATPGLDLVTATSLKLADGTPAVIAMTGRSTGSTFELTYYGESGWVRARRGELDWETASGSGREEFATQGSNIDLDFVNAVRQQSAPCCPAEEAVASVRLLEAVVRSVGSGQVVRLV